MPNTPISPDLKGYEFKDYRDPIWGDSYNWDFARNYDQITHLAIHHSVTDHNASPDYIADLHRKNGWGGIGYHLLVSYSGKVWYVGDILTGRANIVGNNEKIIGICLIGDFTKELPSAHQILATHRLCDYFINKFPALKKIDSFEKVIGHQDAYAVLKWPKATATTCPSPNWRHPQDALRTRIIQGNYKGYPDWENAKGVTVTPTPAPAPVPAPQPPAVVSDPSARVKIEGYNEMELRSVKELLDRLTTDKKTLTADIEKALKAKIDAEVAMVDAQNKLKQAANAWKALNEILK